MARRRWYTSLIVLPKTVFRTAGIFKSQRLGSLTPAFMILLLLAAVLWVISTIAPLAPFVYSLF